MSILLGNPFFLNAGAAGGYQISRSLRFNSADSAYLSRTPASAGNRKTWTWAGWVKRSALGTFQYIWGNANSSAENGFMFRFDSGDVIRIADWTNTAVWQKITSQVFRDVSAWYHIVISYDTTNATAADRVRLYVNGTRVTAFSTSTDPTQNYDGYTNNTSPDSIGRWGGQADYYLNGYLADIHFIDGQALTPSSFTEVSATTGQLIPKAYTGTFGTNGFWLKFADNSSNTATTLGADSSGNGNNWTPNNLSVTAGAGNDSLVDTPTSYGTDTGAGGEVRGNYCTLNPLNKGTNAILFDGNLAYGATSGSGSVIAVGSIGVTSGKWYWECALTGTYTVIGAYRSGSLSATYLGESGVSFAVNNNGNIVYSGIPAPTGSITFNSSHTIGFALDLDAGTCVLYKNGVSAVTFSGLSGQWFPAAGTNDNIPNSCVFNFGQRPFVYPVSGFKALCDTNLPAPVVAKPNEVMDVKLYTGNGSTQTISGLGFSPDLVWCKSRSVGNSHHVTDIVRGVEKALSTDYTGAENWAGANGDLTAFTSDGFTMRQSATWDYNGSGKTYAAWCWDAGTSTVTNTQGSITSSVRANPSAGFSVVSWTGGAAGTVGHGLNVAPSFAITKSRTSAAPWRIWHGSFSSLANYIGFDTDPVGTFSPGNYWQSFTSSTIGFAGGYDNNTGNMVAYCFAPVAGYSAMGSYVGNGSSDGPMITTMFRPRWVLIKCTTVAGEGWFLLDSARSPYNVSQAFLVPNASDSEASAYTIMDILSNGFKLKTSGGGAAFNGSGATYIYAAFAESPFQYARAR